MVSVETRLNENWLLILNFFFIAFMLGWQANFLIMDLIVSFLVDIEVSSGQLKRFNESVIDPKRLLKVEATSLHNDLHIVSKLFLDRVEDSFFVKLMIL